MKDGTPSSANVIPDVPISGVSVEVSDMVEDQMLS